MMLATWARVFARSSGLAFKSVGPLARTVDVILVDQLPAGRRLLATASAARKPLKKATAKTTTRKVTATKKPTTTRKPAAKKTATRSTAAKKKTVTKKKAPAKKKVAVKKSRKPVKKELSPEKKLRIQIKELRERALDPPNIRSTASLWIAYCMERFEQMKASGQKAGSLPTLTPKFAEDFKKLPDAELKALAQKVEGNQELKGKALQTWVNKHTPAQIHDANLARKQLRRIQKDNPKFRGISTLHFPDIPDDRYPKRGRSAQLYYAMDAIKDAEDKRTALTKAMSAWTTLPDADKKKWRDMAAKDQARFENELKAIGITSR